MAPTGSRIGTARAGLDGPAAPSCNQTAEEYTGRPATSPGLLRHPEEAKPKVVPDRVSVRDGTGITARRTYQLGPGQDARLPVTFGAVREDQSWRWIGHGPP